jgi:Na+-driven multidrug efflux pump
MVMSIYTLTDAIVIGQGVGANALAALAGVVRCAKHYKIP